MDISRRVSFCTMTTTEYPPGLLALGIEMRSLQADNRFWFCREDLLTYIDRRKRRTGTNSGGCSTWNGGPASSTRKVFKFLLKLFKVNDAAKFVNIRQRTIDPEGFVRVFRAEIQNTVNLGHTAVGVALRRLEEAGIISRKHGTDENGHQITWLRINPTGIYTALRNLTRFRQASEDMRGAEILIEPVVADPYVELVEVDYYEPESSKITQQNRAVCSDEPLPDLRHIISHAGAGDSGVAGPVPGVDVTGVTPGVDVVVMQGPDAPGDQQRESEIASAAPAGVLQPGEGNPATSRLSQERQQQIQRMDAAARRSGLKLAPCALEGGAPFLIPGDMQISYPRLNKDGSVFKPSLPHYLDPSARHEQPAEPPPLPEVVQCPELTVEKRLSLTSTASPEQAKRIVLPHSEYEVLKVLVRIFNLTEEGMNDQQMAKFLSWVRHPSPAVRMTEQSLVIYEIARENSHNVKDWWLECKLDFFLKTWPMIHKIVFADREVTAATQDAAFQLACVAYARPEQFLNIQIRRASEHLSQTRFVRRGVMPSEWLLGPDEICRPAAWDKLYMDNLRNPAIWPFMMSTDPNGVVTAARAGFDVSGSPMRDAMVARDAHLIVLLIESTRRKEHWPELDNDWVRQEARRMINQFEPLRRVFEHFGVFYNYKDIGIISAATGAPHLVPGRDTDQIREHYDVQAKAIARCRQRFELSFFGRLAVLADCSDASSFDGAQEEMAALLQPFSIHAH